MVEIVWRDEAKENLLEILAFIANENAVAAADYVAGIRIAVDQLADFPQFGRRHDPRFRRIIYRNHIIFYEHEETEDRVVIITIIDGRRDLAKLLIAEP